MAVTLRGDLQSGKGSPLTNQELDDNFKIIGLEHGDTVANIDVATLKVDPDDYVSSPLNLDSAVDLHSIAKMKIATSSIPLHIVRTGPFSSNSLLWMCKDLEGDTSIGSSNGSQFFTIIGDQKEFIVSANFSKGQNLVWSNGEVDEYNGEYTLTVYDKAAGSSEQSINAITSNSSQTAMRNKLVVWNNPVESGDTNLSNFYFEYTGTQKDDSSAVIGLRNYNADTNTSTMTLSEDKVKADLPFETVHLTSTERDALTASNGMVIYNTDNNRFEFYENGGWVYYSGTSV
jgi:hypothetical protein